MAVKAGRQSVFNEINITPLTDIFLVLLIIMMVVAPMMQALQNDIQPPALENGQGVEPSRLTVEVNAAGEYFLEAQPVKLEELPERMKVVADELKLKPEDRNVIVRADQKTRTAAVIKVFEAAQQAEFHKVTVAGQSKSAQKSTQAQEAQTQTEMFEDPLSSGTDPASLPVASQ